MADLIEQRDLADTAGNEKLYQHLCGRIDELEQEEHG